MIAEGRLAAAGTPILTIVEPGVVWLRALVPAERVFTPDPANRAVYDRLYAEFPRLYQSQRGMFRRLN